MMGKRARELWRRSRGDLGWIAFFLCAGAALQLVNLAPPTPFKQSGEKVPARVLTVNDRYITMQGLLTYGHQQLEVEILRGKHAGERFAAQNLLRAQLDLDKMYRPGDVVLVGILDGSVEGESTINAQEYFTVEHALWLFALFGLILAVFGGLTGIKALISFVFTCQVLWKLVIPLCLRGYNPIWVTLAAVTLLTAAIIFIVAGWNRKGVTAFAGSMLGVLTGCGLSIAFTHLFRVNGAVMPYSQTLIYAGFQNLNLTDLFIGGIFLASSGAVMDLGMDVAAGMREVVEHRPNLSRRALASSGFRIGRSVVGTMPTTVLLAYSGGYLTLLMMFAAEGISPWEFLNHPHVAAEVVKTLVGSLGLVLVAPFTAIVGALLLPVKNKKNKNRKNKSNRAAKRRSALRHTETPVQQADPAGRPRRRSRPKGAKSK